MTGAQSPSAHSADEEINWNSWLESLAFQGAMGGLPSPLFNRKGLRERESPMIMRESKASRAGDQRRPF
jgi:hypothetical protein